MDLQTSNIYNPTAGGVLAIVKNIIAYLVSEQKLNILLTKIQYILIFSNWLRGENGSLGTTPHMVWQ